ncbi:methionine gamma-lyase family protein [Christensenellaceae bacterium OttesenSCG-928-L17]|nr:methionine gamma-lyase family protein [Christensenellaceae bacterium OttesenSCG-928-L17]
MENNSSKLPVSAQSEQAILLAEEQLQSVFSGIQKIEQANQWKVLSAFQEEGIASRHFAATTGYGYDDIARDTLDCVFARAFCAEDALVRPQMVNGTHAIYLALSGLLRPGDTLLSITGKPYDTLRDAICSPDDSNLGALSEFGIQYAEIPLEADGSIALSRVMETLEKDKRIRVVYAQRSRGYAWREAITIETMKQVFAAVKHVRKDVWIVVDNCYGEFTCLEEPTQAGADIIAGSLIKNPGGGLAPTGGYVAGKANAVAQIANRMTIPGMGREVGSYAASYQPYYQGLFMAPHTTAESLKTAILFARVLENAGMETMPQSEAPRSDIIQALRLPDAKTLIAFCQSIQKAAPIDSFVVPEPWEMPGYQCPVIMAAGAFVQGASIELSADAPIKEPYTAYVQGSLTYAHGRIGAMMALDALHASAR